MVIEFDPINKLIKITAGTEITALAIYNSVMDWCDAQENIGYSVPMSAVGKAPLGGGVYSDSIFVLQNGWKIKLYDGTYQFTIFGTVITDDETPRTVPPDSGNVEVVFQVSSQATVIPDEAEWTQIEKNGIISDVNIIEAKTGNLPADPASQSLVEMVKAKTDNLPTDPARESSVERVEETLILHDSDVRGNPPDVDANLTTLKELLKELAARKAVVEAEPKSIAQALRKKLRS